jgi:hypothetical protein
MPDFRWPSSKAELVAWGSWNEIAKPRLNLSTVHLRSAPLRRLPSASIIRARVGDVAAVEHAEMGIRLSPNDPVIYLPYVGLACALFFRTVFRGGGKCCEPDISRRRQA